MELACAAFAFLVVGVRQASAVNVLQYLQMILPNSEFDHHSGS
jgi:hypothetical protein